MFVDKVRLTLRAGKGGNGAVSWRREKYIPKGGPSGGNGGRGGSVYLRTSPHAFTLERFVNKRIISAQNGVAGSSNRRQGALGKNLFLDVPLGTLVKDAETGEILFDLDTPGQEILICDGGKGGLGNYFFKTPTRQAPNFCTPGKPGQEREIELELKLIAEVGLVGYPNAGKSTLFSSLTDKRAKAAAYPFTTLHPNLSYIEFEDYTRLHIADIPGIIGGASQDRGLGLEFLKHIERTKTLVFIIDISSTDGRDPFQDFLSLRKEVEAYSPATAAKPFITILNKTDIENTAPAIESFKQQYPYPAETLLCASAFTGDGLEQIITSLRPQLQKTN